MYQESGLKELSFPVCTISGVLCWLTFCLNVKQLKPVRDDSITVIFKSVSLLLVCIRHDESLTG